MESGIEVKFYVDSTLTINGNLQATEVQFSKEEVDKWKGLSFKAGSDESELNNCFIIDATTALRIEESSPRITGTLLDFSTARDTIGTTAIELTGVSSPELDNIDIFNYATGIQITNTDSRTSSTPIMSNIRIRNTENSTRTETVGMSVEGEVDIQLTEIDIEEYDLGLRMEAAEQSSTPIMSNIRIRNTENSPREFGGTGISFTGEINAVIDSLVVEEFFVGMEILNTAGRSSSTPIMSNIRIRNTENSTRTTGSTGLIIQGDVDIRLEDAEIEEFTDGVKIISGQSSTTPIMSNIRIRNTENSTRILGGTGISFIGEIDAQIDTLVVEAFAVGMEIVNSDRASSTPIMSNIRIRNSENSTRTIGEKGLTITGSVDVQMDDVEIEEFTDGMEILGGQSTPIMSNIRIRNTENSTRIQGDTGLYLSQQIDAHIDSLEIENFDIGLEIVNIDRSTSTPIMSNIRIRNTENSTRTPALGFSIAGDVDFLVDDMEILNYLTGIELDAGSGARSSTPIMSNIRIRNTENSTRTGDVGIYLGDLFNVELKESEIEGFTTGILVEGDNQSDIFENRIIDCFTAVNIIGALAQPSVHNNDIYLDQLTNQACVSFVTEGCNNLVFEKNTIIGYDIICITTAADVFLSGNIIWNDTDITTPANATDGSVVIFDYNNINTTAAVDGAGNINNAPLFVNADEFNYELHYNSPCIDAGDPNGEPDPDETIPDIGAHYYHHLAELDSDVRFISPGTEVFFTDLSQGHNYQETTWLWTFGDGNTSANQNPSHVYPDVGIYTVSLQVATGNLVDSIEQTNYILIQAHNLLAPENPAIVINGNDAILSWNEVTSTVGMDPMEITVYLVYSSDTMDGIYEFRAQTNDELFWTDENVLLTESNQFYFIIGYTGQQREIIRYIQEHQYLRRDGSKASINEIGKMQRKSKKKK